jgi:beta-lactam-binding protein with PASTA domain
MAEPTRGRFPLRGTVLLVLVLLGAFALGIGVFNYIVMPSLVGHGTVVIVPDVGGLSVEQARVLCEKRGLRLEELRRQYSDEYPEGMVLSQEPYAHANVKSGRWVRVVVSRGAITEYVPDLLGVSPRQARLLLERNQLRLGPVAKVYRSGGPNGTIVSSRPPPGAELSRGDSVRVLVSYGTAPRLFLMPDLAGKDLIFVRRRLEELGFPIGRVVFERDRSKFPNTILSHRPAPGSLIREGESIDLVASTTD